MPVTAPGHLFYLRTQLTTDLPTEGEDCGPLACVNTIRQASQGHVGPRHEADVPGWVKFIRRLAKRPTGPFKVLGDTYEALNHPELAERFHRNGLPRLQPDYTYGLGWDAYIARLRKHQIGLLAVDYGVLNNGHAPSGDPKFRGAHILLNMEADLTIRRIRTLDGDSLFDGRRAGIPKNWQEADLIEFKAAAGAFGDPTVGYGRVIAITVPRVA